MVSQQMARDRALSRAQPFWLVLAGSVLLTAAAASVGSLFLPGAWYAALAKPSWNPPNWIFAPVWSVLYVMIAVSGARAWRAGASAGILIWWVLQLALNAAWTYLFFGLERPGLALIEIAALLASILVYLGRVWTVDRTSALLVMPYAAWVSFASVLNAAIWRLNG